MESVEAAETSVTEQCMRRIGIDYHAEPAKSGEWGVEEDRRYGIQDRERASLYGYHPISVVHPPEKSKAQLSDAELAALWGKTEKGVPLRRGAKSPNGKVIPPGGCSGEADRKIRAPYDYAEGVSVARTIDFEGYKRSLKDPAVTKVFADWSSCMRAEGYSYASPVEAMGSPAFSSTEVSDQERAVAKSDIGCKQKVDLIHRWNAAETAIQMPMIKKNQATLDKFLSLQKDKVAAAGKLLEHHG
ncbi:hypothetical protein ACFWMU_08970 [Streptomyces sp. NPDC058357]|uniref:hypothetical protein n=1 Tax=unclassified Streptomyces TaxID=2593676 RepID=UPI003653B915